MDERDTYLPEMVRMVGGKSAPDVVKAYTLENTVAILQKRARHNKVTFSRDVALYLARNFHSNASALETAFLRLIAYSTQSGTEISLPYTQQLLKNFVDSQEHRVSIDSLPKLFSECAGGNESRARRQAWTTADRDYILCLLKASDGRKIRHQFEVNLRESERERLARRDVYERASELRVKKRRYSA